VTDVVAKCRGQAHMGAQRSWVADGAEGVERGPAQLEGRGELAACLGQRRLNTQQMPPREGPAGLPGAPFEPPERRRDPGQIAAFPQGIDDPEPAPQFYRCAAQATTHLNHPRGPGYQFGSGIGEDELARLEAQGAAMAPATRMIFAEAGIQPGMRVLDLGCGAGDVAFAAADLVGPDGSVVGVDRSPEALARARLRAEQRGLTQVRFVTAASTSLWTRHERGCHCCSAPV